MKRSLKVVQIVLECGIPESFNVLIKELKALGLDVNMIETGHAKVEAQKLAQAEAKASATAEA